jgi:putative ABC transport system permease protein
MNIKKIISIEFLLAWRNVWKNKRRTILTLLTIAVGTIMILSMNALGNGGHIQMIEDAVKVDMGHIQIHEKGFWENQSIEYALKITPELESMLHKNKKISAFSVRVNAGGLLSYKDTTAGSVIQGVNPAKDKGVSTISEKILSEGRYLLPGDRDSILLGEVLAKNLDVKVGMKISLISQGFDGSIAAENLNVVGIFKSGNAEYDKTLAIMPIEQMKDTFTMMGYINSIVIRTKEVKFVDEVKIEIEKFINNKKIEVMTWNELIPELVQWIVMDDAGAYIFDVILFLVVAFGILNTILMSVYERTREFGVMLAIGTRPGQIISIVLFESIIISIIGIIIGIAIGSGISIYFEINPIVLSQYANEMAAFKVNTTVFPAKLTLLNITVTSILTFLLSFLFTIIPARKAAKLNPIEAIRHL